ncbi:MAG: hypothetical protein NW206_18985 [Hyphomonadaceae bacterium]|nr:hypothetical protein [Hyphomonadaceae bacterium]
MNDFNAALTRAFAEEHHEPADDGFSFRVTEAVARKEKRAVWVAVAQGLAVATAIAAVALGLLAGLAAFGPAIMASLGLEVARAHGALTAFDTTSLAAGMTQFLLFAGALAGAGMVYRNSQQQ